MMSINDIVVYKDKLYLIKDFDSKHILLTGIINQYSKQIPIDSPLEYPLVQLDEHKIMDFNLTTKTLSAIANHDLHKGETSQKLSQIPDCFYKSMLDTYNKNYMHDNNNIDLGYITIVTYSWPTNKKVEQIVNFYTDPSKLYYQDSDFYCTNR